MIDYQEEQKRTKNFFKKYKEQLFCSKFYNKAEVAYEEMCKGNLSHDDILQEYKSLLLYVKELEYIYYLNRLNLPESESKNETISCPSSPLVGPRQNIQPLHIHERTNLFTTSNRKDSPITEDTFQENNIFGSVTDGITFYERLTNWKNHNKLKVPALTFCTLQQPITTVRDVKGSLKNVKGNKKTKNNNRILKLRSFDGDAMTYNVRFKQDKHNVIKGTPVKLGLIKKK